MNSFHVFCFQLVFLVSTKVDQLLGVLVCSPQTITVFSGDDVVLSCGLQPPTSAESMRVEWTRPDLQPQFIHVHQDGRFLYQDQNPSYNYRTKLFVDQLIDGNVSLRLSRVKPSDAGRYRCSLPSIQQEAGIQLNVESRNVIGSNEPVHAVVGGDVILPCHLEPPFDVKNLTVEWKYNNETVHNYRSLKDDPDLQSDKFKSRTSLFHEEMFKGNISLKLTNVTETDAGNYTCYVPKLESQVKRGNVSLVVEKKDKDEMKNKDETSSTGPRSGGIAAVVIPVVLIVLVVGGASIFGYLKWKHSLKDRNEPNRRSSEKNEEERPEGLTLVEVATDNKENDEEKNTDDEEHNNGDIT